MLNRLKTLTIYLSKTIQECHMSCHEKFECLEQQRHHQGPSYQSGYLT